MSFSPCRRRVTRSLAAAVTVAAPALCAVPAFAAPATLAVRLPQQSLADSLQDLARISGHDILFSSAAVSGRRAPAVSGAMTVEQATGKLLRGSGLHAVEKPGGDLVIEATAPVTSQPGKDARATRAAPHAEKITVIGKAQRLAPSTVPLTITEPKSVIQERFIRNNIVPLASVDDIIKFQPSVWSQSPNGPGIGKAEAITLRGFQDGQYNMTFDGIPFGDASNLHHTTSALFISHFLRQVDVDRGPGTAATSGNATFGGTIGFKSRNPSSRFGVTPYGTYGSFNTRAGGLQVDTGKTRFGKMVLDMQHEETDGYLTGSYERRSNVLFKDVARLGPETTLTVLTTYDKEWQYTTQGATLAEYAQYGKNYGLCYNPALQCYYGHNPSRYESDFSYIE